MFAEIEIEELAEKIIKMREGYYGGKPIASDPEYDAAEKRLAELCPDHELLKEVGTDFKSSSFADVFHEVLMLSLDKAYSVDEIVSWVPGNDGVAMPKMDGFAVSLKYQLQGDFFVLTCGATRGKGQKGEDVTENVKQVKDIPHRIPAGLVFSGLTRFEVRGEVYMKRSTFTRLGLDKEYENCRNIAPGSVRQKDPKVTRDRELNFFAYNIITPEIPIPTMLMKFAVIKNMGIPVVPSVAVDMSSREKLQLAFDSFAAVRESNDYDMDGVVFCLNDCFEIERLGNTSHHPRAFIAWKFEAEEGETTLTTCEWQVSRTSQINPVGIFNAIRLEGASITNATLHNLSEIERLGIGIGDRIIVSRRGGVIPKIERVVKAADSPRLEIPSKCPVCGSETEIRESKDGTKTLHCPNIDCPAVTATRILHFIKTMEIDDIAEGMLTKLMEAGFVTEVYDLFKVNREQLLTLPSVKDKTADRAIQNINLARKRPLGVFLAALGIRTMGVSVADTVADVFGSLDKILAATESDLMGITGIGPEIAKNIVKGLAAKKDVIAALCKEVEIIAKAKPVEGGKLAGKTFLITGTLSMPRGDFEKIIEDNGGVVSSSVSKSLNYLIVGDAPGGKLAKAQKAGVTIITEEEFNKLIG